MAVERISPSPTHKVASNNSRNGNANQVHEGETPYNTEPVKIMICDKMRSKKASVIMDIGTISRGNTILDTMCAFIKKEPTDSMMALLTKLHIAIPINRNSGYREMFTENTTEKKKK